MMLKNVIFIKSIVEKMRTLNVYSKQIIMCVWCALSFTLSHMYNAHAQVPTCAKKIKQRRKLRLVLVHYRHSVCTYTQACMCHESAQRFLVTL